jgi:DNA mismatch repair protein MutL
MSQIRILPEMLSNKIAAGERWWNARRPWSRNWWKMPSMPAAAAFWLKSNRAAETDPCVGQRTGHGPGRCPALPGAIRHQQDCQPDPDLFAIRTLGFRGEALPSIASVSRFTLVTRETDADVGTRIEVAGGRINNVSDAGAPPGTMITVAGLFYNTPARRKFLKSINTEMGHIADTIASMALCRPPFNSSCRTTTGSSKAGRRQQTHADRVADVLGAGVKKGAACGRTGTEDIEISGWVTAPRMNRSTARGIYLFVNGRWVKDRVIQHALFAGYSGRLMKGQYPVAVLFLKVPFDQVDVNVHPTKHEIRFVRQKWFTTPCGTRWQTPSCNPIRPAGKHLNGRLPSHFDGRRLCPSRTADYGRPQERLNPSLHPNR